MIIRAALTVVLALGLLAAPLAAEAQPAAKLARIGWLSPGSTSSHGPFLAAFQEGLRELGYMEGKNIAIEYRWAEGRVDRLPQLVTELIQLKVDVLVTAGAPGIRAAKQATTTIPIVMAVGGDPVGSGFVASLARPGGNITGLSNLAEDLVAKLLELLREAVPGGSRVAVLYNPANPAHVSFRRVIQSAARTMGVTLLPVEGRGPHDFDGAFATMLQQRAEGLVELPDPMFLTERNRLADLASRNRMPAIYGFREHVAAGGLMAYGVNLRDSYRRAATYVDKILKGAKPADLPVEQPTRFELVINLKTAKALGLTIPRSLLLRADEVIE
jgi:putative ABC transport system substrate-binding protein